MSRHYFVNEFLKEISIIIILISYLNFHASKSTRFALIYYQFIIKRCVTELMKSIKGTLMQI